MKLSARKQLVPIFAILVGLTAAVIGSELQNNANQPAEDTAMIICQAPGLCARPPGPPGSPHAQSHAHAGR